MAHMTANDIFQDSRVAHVRELKREVAELREELARARAELESLRSHFDLALKAARDAEALPPGGTLLVVDGWNALLGSASVLPPEARRMPAAEKREALRALVLAWLDAHPQDAAWIVFDGGQAGGTAEERLHVTFTGGTGPHRADRMVCDYLRMRRLSGTVRAIVVLTEDRDFRRAAEQLGAQVRSVRELARG